MSDESTGGMEQFEEWLREQRKEAQQKYENNGPRSSNPRKTDIQLGKFRAFRKAHRECINRLEESGNIDEDGGRDD